MLKLTVLGNLGGDAEVKSVGDRSVISFNVAHNERYRDKASQSWQERTIWVRCNYWRDPQRTGVAEYLKKGVPVYIEGDLIVQAYTNKEGQPTAGIDCRVRVLQLVGGSKNDSSQGGNEDDLPF